MINTPAVIAELIEEQRSGLAGRAVGNAHVQGGDDTTLKDCFASLTPKAFAPLTGRALAMDAHQK